MKKAKYRIIEYIDDLGNSYYRVEYKFLFFWKELERISIDGSLSCPMDFDSIEEAEKAVNNLKKQNRNFRKIVKEIY